MTNQRILLRPEQAAAALAISRARLYQLLRDGTIASVKLGSSRRVPLADLVEYVDGLKANDGEQRRRAQAEATHGRA